MNVERETIVILVLLLAVLAPLWFFALQTHEAQPQVELSPEQGAIEPTERFVDSPVEVNEFVAGVITWVALFVLVGLIFATHELIRGVGRSGEPTVPDGGVTPLLSTVLTDDRRLVDYWAAEYSVRGLVGLVLATGASLLFGALFAVEALTLARTQFLGTYGGAMFLSLGVLVAVYATWFVPSMHVVEERSHEEIADHDPEDSEL